MHPGRSQRARISASTHTGALAGDHAMMTALLRHAAVVVVDTIEELVDTAEFLARRKPPTKGPGVITNSGAIKGFALDFGEASGSIFRRLRARRSTRSSRSLPPFASLDNPLDITAMVLRDITLWPRSAQALLADPGIGSLCLSMVAGSPKYAMDKANALLPEHRARGKPAVIAVLGDEAPVPPEFLAAFREKGVPVFRSPERALRALAHATAYGRRLAARERRRQAVDAPALPAAARCRNTRARPTSPRSASRCRKASLRATSTRPRRSRRASAIRWRSRRRRQRSRTRATRAASR